MTRRRDTVLNYLGYQSGWMACVLGAALGLGTEGASLALLLTALHVAFARDRASEAQLVVAAALTGLLVESWQIHAGTYASLAGTASESGVPPLWLLALWAQFATTFRDTLTAVLRRPAMAAIFGAVGGPLAFLAGERLGAVTLGVPLGMMLLRLSVAWALAMLVLAAITGVVERRAGSPGYRWGPRGAGSVR